MQALAFTYAPYQGTLYGLDFLYTVAVAKVKIPKEDVTINTQNEKSYLPYLVNCKLNSVSNNVKDSVLRVSKVSGFSQTIESSFVIKAYSILEDVYTLRTNSVIQ